MLITVVNLKKLHGKQSMQMEVKVNDHNDHNYNADTRQCLFL